MPYRGELFATLRDCELPDAGRDGTRLGGERNKRLKGSTSGGYSFHRRKTIRQPIVDSRVPLA